MEPLRAGEEASATLIHKVMLERLILCEYAIADLTTVNPSVFYELGVRHGVRPSSTALLYAEDARLPFDVSSFRAFTYRLDKNGEPARPESDRDGIVDMLQRCKLNPEPDSPVYQLVQGIQPPPIDRLRIDTLREQISYTRAKKEELARARRVGPSAVDSVRASLGKLEDVEAGVVVDLLLSYRAVRRWDAMIELYQEMPRYLQTSVPVGEQYALALNRAGQGAEAERTLRELVERRGPSSETLGILGRVYKDRWEQARSDGDMQAAQEHLEAAIDAYRKAFEADWRNAYPGVHAVTLMEFKLPPDPERLKLVPVVTYAVERRIAAGKPDYWDWATLVELAVLGQDEVGATRAASQALTNLRETWEAETTARNLRLIREARAQHGEAVPWANKLEESFAGRAS
jgi:tetratricopeptide (TPR) repeat protein